MYIDACTQTNILKIKYMHIYTLCIGNLLIFVTQFLIVYHIYKIFNALKNSCHCNNLCNQNIYKKYKRKLMLK